MQTGEKTTYKEWTITRKGSLFYTLSHEKFPSTLFNLTADAVLDKIVSNDLYKISNSYIKFMYQYELYVGITERN